ncbi:LysR family transcriptional regulator ArgP [Azospirillum argentinense]
MLDYALLAALAAVVRTGSFERAAAQLHVTPSAVSQRVKLLEERMGTILVVRGSPCTGTPAGLRLSQHAERVALLESELRDGLPGVPQDGPAVTVRMAVNADSLATWFVAAMAGTPDVLFDLVLDDQEHSADWLRRGEVLAAVTSGAQPVQGCDSTALGALRYVATASPDFLCRHFPDGVAVAALARAPRLTYNSKDRLQTQWTRQAFGVEIASPTHWMPSTHAFVDAALAGLGWGMNPEPLVAGPLRDGRLVALVPDQPLDVPLFWQRSRIASRTLADITRSVLTTARAQLTQV